MAYGIKTTIIEIDPVVHDFATKYFNLPKNRNKVIADAVFYAAEVARSNEKYYYVVHDVFTSGAEPVNLFTYKFLQNLNLISKPGGVIAINYAGDLLPSARIIIQTILTVFPTYRIYRESAQPIPKQIASDGRDFINIAIFYTNAASDVNFRAPIKKNFVGSKAKQAYLLPQQKVDYSTFEVQEGIGGPLRRNDTERFRGGRRRAREGTAML